MKAFNNILIDLINSNKLGQKDMHITFTDYSVPYPSIIIYVIVFEQDLLHSIFL